MKGTYAFVERLRSAGHRSSAVAVAIGLGFLGMQVANAADSSVLSKGADISTMCGKKELRVGLSDGFGGNTWRKTVEAEVRDEASKCPNIKEVIYADAGGDQQKYNSDVNSLVAQGINVFVTFADFGDASIPQYRNALAADVTVVPYFSKLSGTAGKDYSANVTLDYSVSGKLWADWYGENVKKGNLIFLGGIPGATSSVGFLDGFKDGLKKYPDLKLLSDDYIVTNWNPADAQKAMTGLLAKYPQIDGVVTDYGVTALAVIRVFQQSDRKVPPIATVASNNELNCKFLSDKKAGKAWSYFTADGTTRLARFALRRAVAIAEGTEDKETLAVAPYAYADSFKGKDPACNENAPPDADLSTGLPADVLAKLFKK